MTWEDVGPGPPSALQTQPIVTGLGLRRKVRGEWVASCRRGSRPVRLWAGLHMESGVLTAHRAGSTLPHKDTEQPT